MIVSAIGCGGRQGRGPEAPLSVADAGLPFSILRGKSGETIPAKVFIEELGDAHLVCVGESHNNPHHHWVQLWIAKRLFPRWLGKGEAKPRPIALGLEMFQRPFQGVLDDYGKGLISEETMLQRTDWQNRWGFPYANYKPSVDVAIELGARVLALNASTELKKSVSKNGVKNLTKDEQSRLPELNIKNSKHRKWWDAVMDSMAGTHGHGHGTMEAAKEMSEAERQKQRDRMYAVQVLWDETMADTSASFLEENPNGGVMVLAGGGHCHDSAIIGRVVRRGIPRAISVLPIIEGDDGEVANAISSGKNDYLFVLTPELSRAK